MTWFIFWIGASVGFVLGFLLRSLFEILRDDDKDQ